MNYGSFELMNRSDPLLPRQDTERRRAFAKRRQNASRKLMGKPVLQRLFYERSTSSSTTVEKQATTKRPTRHSFIYLLLSPYSRELPARIFKGVVTTVILVDLVLFILSTDPRLDIAFDTFFHAAEGFVSTLFLIEYVARLWVIIESKRYRDMSPWQARLQYMTTLPAVIDLLSCLPFFLEIPTGVNLPTLTYLRFLRLFRILKTQGSIRALDAVYRVIYYNFEILSVAALVCLYLVLITAVLLYYLRPQNPEDAEDFQSISATLYLSTLMLTGQGGPSGDLPWYTKAVVLLTSVFSVAMFAIPASMLTWGFEAEAERMAKRARQQQSTRGGGSSSSPEEYESDDGYSTDEEYFKIIAGADEEPAEDEPEFVKELRRNFASADTNADGTLTLAEYLRMQQQGPSPERLDRLEQQIKATNAKLDTLLAVLEKKRGWLT